MDVSWVHVGNLDPAATEEGLKAHFSQCGTVEQVSIRYSGSGTGGRPAACYRYAIVGFSSPGEATAALDYSGDCVQGSTYKLVVSPDPVGLPEVQRLPEMYDVRAKHSNVVSGLPPRRPGVVPIGHLHTASGMQGLPAGTSLAKTTLWKPTEEQKRRKRRANGKSMAICGVSFAMTLV
ncbi:hypothetical protein GGX14DRAFT_453856 [Mycena pura]|uniref:RRM domain-containing protein n=1 Tax=Mycena pura TaxID=153505 RepID=A0AAD6VDV8_9AGAR|nr:hypothetical protein GGX14DRAFT_453856 [Mycena pura]